jgi:hypothetical protein
MYTAYIVFSGSLRHRLNRFDSESDGTRRSVDVAWSGLGSQTMVKLCGSFIQGCSITFRNLVLARVESLAQHAAVNLRRGIHKKANSVR